MKTRPREPVDGIVLVLSVPYLADSTEDGVDDYAKELRRELAGFSMAKDYGGPLPKECNLIIEKGELAGRVTSIGRSPALGCPIGLAYVRPEQKEAGTIIHIKLSDGTLAEAKVVKLPFYDPENLKQKPPQGNGRETT